MTVVIKCHSVNHDTFNAKLTLFKMSLLGQLDIRNHNLSTCHKYVITGLIIKIKEVI